MEFYLLLRELRQSRRLTQEALAEALGVTRQTVIQLEHGRFAPSFGLARELAEFFDCSFDELLGIDRPVGYHEYEQFVTAEIDLPAGAKRDQIRVEIKGDRLVVTIPLLLKARREIRS